MRAGRLDKQVTIQARGQVPDSLGTPIDTWVDVATIWVSIEPLRGRELIAAQQEQSEVTTRIRIRFRRGISSDWRLKFGTIYYAILSVIDFRMEHAELELMCVEASYDQP